MEEFIPLDRLSSATTGVPQACWQSGGNTFSKPCGRYNKRQVCQEFKLYGLIIGVQAGYEQLGEVLCVADERGYLRELSFIRDAYDKNRAQSFVLLQSSLAHSASGETDGFEGAEKTAFPSEVYNRLMQVRDEYKAYLRDPHMGFSLSEEELHELGTPFQQEVYRAVRSLACSELATYGEIAQQIGRPRAYRAVAQALKANQLILVIPCHRIISAGGIGGFWCGLGYKKYLMRHEGIRGFGLEESF